FTHPRYPDLKFRVRVQEDFVSGGVFGGAAEGKFLAYIEMLPKDPGAKPYVVALATDIYQLADGSMHFGWLTAFSYKALFERVAETKSKLRNKSASYFDALMAHMIFGRRDALHPQLKLLAGYLPAKFGKQAISDVEFLDYFSNQTVAADK